MENTALIIIDIQNDYFPNGKMELEGSIKAAEQAKKTIDVFREKGRPIYFIQHESLQPGASFLVPNTEGNQIHELVKPLPDETVIIKHYPNSFRETELLDKLKEQGIKKLVIVGMMTFMCVDATVRAGFDLGYECVVLHDATAARALEFENDAIPASQVQGSFLAALGMAYAKVEGTEAFIGS